MMETYLGYAPRGLGSFLTAMPNLAEGKIQLAFDLGLKQRRPERGLLETPAGWSSASPNRLPQTSSRRPENTKR
jgi:hypothetical protein